MRASVERVEESPVHISQNCQNCDTLSRCRRRDFSEQAWSVLLAWGEVDSTAVDQPICEDCYAELRDILIDRADEMSHALANPGHFRQNNIINQAANSAKKKKAAAPSVPAAKKKPAARTTVGKKKARRVA